MTRPEENINDKMDSNQIGTTYKPGVEEKDTINPSTLYILNIKARRQEKK